MIITISEVAGGLYAWLMLCFLTALVGDRRKIGFGWTFAISFFLTPIIGLIVILLSEKNNN